MNVIERSYNDYTETNSEGMQSEIDAAINHAKSDLNDLKSEVLGGGKKTDFKTPSSINKFYRLEEEGKKIVFQLDEVKKYLSEVFKRLQGMKNQKFGEISKENNFKGTILAIQIALKAFETDPLKPRKYNVGRINGEYNEITKDAIKQFQTDFNLTWKDGKPGKETIGKILNVLNNLTENRKTYKESAEKEDISLKDDVTNIVKESISINSIAGFSITENDRNAIINYILEGNLCTKKDEHIEEQINSISKHPLNRKLKYLMEHHGEPLKNNITNIKEQERKQRNIINQNNIDNRNLDKKNNTQFFYGVKLDTHKAYSVEGVSSKPQGKTNSGAFKNCRLTKRLGRVGLDTTIIEHNGVRINRSKYHEETYYSQKVLPGGGLEKFKGLKGRHVAEDGTVRDGDGYIVVAANLNYAPRDSIVMTSLGPGKVYDTGDLPKGRFDIYVNR